MGPLTDVTDARGAKTLVSYAHQKVSAVRVVTPAEPQIADIVMPYQAAETRGVETVQGAFGPVRADSVGSVFDGPLAGPADTVRFFTLGWGGVRARRDALGATTRVERENPGFPALVTRTVEANGHAVSRSYTGAGRRRSRGTRGSPCRCRRRARKASCGAGRTTRWATA